MITQLIILQAFVAVAPQLGAIMGAAIIVMAASYGISRIGISAIEAIARQPEAAGDIRSSMVVSAALIEGASFFAIIVCILVLFL